jgi:Na+/H+-dicarboxylate symporter
MKQYSLLIKVTIAITLALIVGSFSSNVSVLGVSLLSIYDLFGQLFLNALTLMVIPLVASSIISGIGSLSTGGSVRSMGLKAFFYYVLTTLLAVLTGLFVFHLFPVNFSQPEVALSLTGSSSSALPQDSLFQQIVLRLIPSNLFSAAANSNILGILFFSVLFGLALSKWEGETKNTLLASIQALFQTMMKLTQMVIAFLPIGVFFLVAKSITQNGLAAISSVSIFVAIVLSGFILFLFVITPILLMVKGVSVRRFFSAIFPALITAFSTSSSAATLPVTLECVEKKMGVSHRVASFVLPLGVSVNLTGTALYECVAVLFIAATLGIDLSFSSMLLVALFSLLASMGSAGIPSASIISLMMILEGLGIPSAGIALLLPVERILDMFRTVVNVSSESLSAVLVARAEKEIIMPRSTPSINESVS